MTESSSTSLRPDIPRIGRASVRERVETVLTDLILKDSFSPGDQLPSEAELAKSFGVSRVVLREAMRALEARGLVQTIQGKGILIKEPISSYASEALLLFLQRNTASMMDLWEARVVLETGIVERACQRATSEQLDAMRESIRRWTQAEADIGALVAEDEHFHTTLVQASHNAVLELLMETIADLLQESRKATLKFGSGPDIAGHTAILNALVERDPVAGREAILEHLQHAKNDLIAAGVAGWVEDDNRRE